MLKDLRYGNVEPSFIYASIAQINGVDLSKEENYFEHYTTGVYRHDGYIYNFEGFLKEKCNVNIVDKWVTYGVCDNYEQVLEKHKNLLNDANKNYVVGLSTVKRESQSSKCGWRWRGWGEYIGTQNPQHEYLYDDTHIDKVYCYHIYEVE